MESLISVCDGRLPSDARRLRILLVDDHHVVRAALHALLALEADFDVVGEASDADNGIALAQQLLPDVVVTDLGMGTKNGIYLVSQLRVIAPDSKALVLTVHNDEGHIKAALLAGAHGYVLKDSCRADLVAAICAVGRGEIYLCRPVSNVVVSGFLERPCVSKSLPPLELTDRQREIITHVAQGMTNLVIARQLGLSSKTIAKHRANLMCKLHLQNSASITMFAIEHGLVSPDEIAHQSQH